MAGLFLLMLLALFISYWYVFAALIAVWALACIVDTLWERGAAERAERARHQRARREIDAITVATANVMRRFAREPQHLRHRTKLEVR